MLDMISTPLRSGEKFVVWPPALLMFEPRMARKLP
jgi:hypothetical protein